MQGRRCGTTGRVRAAVAGRLVGLCRMGHMNPSEVNAACNASLAWLAIGRRRLFTFDFSITLAWSSAYSLRLPAGKSSYRGSA